MNWASNSLLLMADLSRQVGLNGLIFAGFSMDLHLQCAFRWSFVEVFRTSIWHEIGFVNRPWFHNKER